MSGILPIIGVRGEEYRNYRRMAINTQVQKVCMEERVGVVDMWLNFVGRDDFFTRYGLHLTGELTEKTQRSTTTNTHPKKCSPIISDNELKCVCLNASSIVNKK